MGVEEHGVVLHEGEGYQQYFREWKHPTTFVFRVSMRCPKVQIPNWNHFVGQAQINYMDPFCLLVFPELDPID